MIQHTYIELFGLQLADPVTFLSDLMMSVVAFYCGHRIFHDFQHIYAKYLGVFFLFLGLSSLLGGTFHLLDVYFGRTPHLIAWTVQGISMLFIGLASVRLISQQKAKNFIRLMIYGFFLLFIYQILRIRHFDIVKVNTAISLIGITSGIHIYKYFVEKDKKYLMVPLSVLLFVLPAAVHGFHLKMNDWINQNVISHIILLPCYYALYVSFRNIAKGIPTSSTQPIQQG